MADRKLEKEMYEMMKAKIKNPEKLNSSHFKIGKMVMYQYNPKYPDKPYDKSPLIIVLGRSRKYTLGLNFHWVPPVARAKLMKFILGKNKKNIEKGIPLEISYDMIKGIIKGMGPCIRLYLNNRISRRGISVEQENFKKIIHLRAENFIGISSKKAWALANKDHRKKKKK